MKKKATKAAPKKSMPMAKPSAKMEGSETAKMMMKYGGKTPKKMGK